MDIFTMVKAAVTVRQAAEHYGLQVNRNGMALCPFHNDCHPSLYVSDDHYHCFACGEHGDVIDLTAKLFDLRLYDAARKLASDFHLAPDKPLPESIRQNGSRKPKHSSFVRTSSCAFLFERIPAAAPGLEKTVCAASAGRCAGQAVCRSLSPSALGGVSAGHPAARRFL